MVLVEVSAAGVRGLGYTFERAAAPIIRELEAVIRNCDVLAIASMHDQLRCAMHGTMAAASAVAAIDIALWDLKARLLELPLALLLGAARTEVPVCAVTAPGTRADRLARDVTEYAVRGHRRISIDLGDNLERATERVQTARDAAGPSVELCVDARGRLTPDAALAIAGPLAALGVTYFARPVSEEDIAGLAHIRSRSSIAIAAGHACQDPVCCNRMLAAHAVDVLEIDATRCLGVTGFLQANALCAAHGIKLAAYGAPAVHVQLGGATSQVAHVATPADSARLEMLLFDGCPPVIGGLARYAEARPGLGLELRRNELHCLAA